MRTYSTSILAITLASSFAFQANAQDPLAEPEPAAPEPAAAEPTPAPTPAAEAPAPAPAPAAPTTPPPAQTATPQASPKASSSIEGTAGPSTRSGPKTGEAWTMTYSGYLRAPMRVGIGNDTIPNGTGTNVAPNYNPVGPTSIHYPVVPDDQYGSWQFTGHNRKDWAEMFFTVGNGTASGTLAVQGFQFTDPAWKQNNSQFGIGQGWVEVNSDLGYENVRFNAKAGSFWARYGMAGVYDAGEYDTYLIGRTHTMGGQARLGIDLGGPVLTFEGGFGAHQPNPEMFNRARFTPMGHIHAMFKTETLDMGLHFMHAWADQGVVPLYPNAQPGSNCDGIRYFEGVANAEGRATQCVPDQGLLGHFNDGGVDPRWTTNTPGALGPEYPNGSQTILGIDAKVDLGLAGYLYAGFSQQLLSNALTVSGAIEALHSFGGGEFDNGMVDNYLESPYCDEYGRYQATPAAPPQFAGGPTDLPYAPNESCSQGNGGVSSLMLQYEIGLANFGIFPGAMDLKFKVYGMGNFVQVSDVERRYLDHVIQQGSAWAAANGVAFDENSVRQNGTIKLKGGIDAEFFLNDWISIGTRFDRLQPHSKVAQQTFNILTPRITFRSKLVTHETITLSYSRYFYNARYCRNDAGIFVSPADSPFREIGGTNPVNDPGAGTTALLLQGLPASTFCVQPAPSASIPSGFGATSDNQPAGTRGAPTLLPDENVVKIEAAMWW
jgi:hypothetical protein